MYNLRYHIASLVAVFLALTLGLVLGTVIGDRGTFDEQRAELVQGLEQDFTDLKDENARLKTSSTRDHAFAVEAVGPLTAGALSGRTVLVIANAGRCDGLNDLTDQIVKTGGTPVVVTFKSRGFGLEDEAVASVVGSAVGRAGMEGLPKRTADVVASELMTVGVRPVLDSLVKTGQLAIGDEGLPERFDSLALLAAFDGTPDPLLVQVAERVRQAGRPVAGLETTQRKTGVAPATAQTGASAVDHLDTPEGLLSASWVLAGRAEGYFGVLPGAQRLFPPLSEQGAKAP